MIIRKYCICFKRLYAYILVILVGTMLFSVSAIAQSVKGIVKDSSNNKPIAFASIQVKGTTNGTFTDIDGFFELTKAVDKKTIIISAVGYLSQQVVVQNNGSNTVIFLQPNKAALDEVVVVSDINPVHRIINLTITNKKVHRPESKSSFKYNAYTIASLGLGDKLFNDISADKKKNINTKQTAKKSKNDSLSQKRNQLTDSFLKKNYLMVTESFTERLYQQPNKSKETILASKISGFSKAPFAFTSASFQPFGFYDDYITMLDKTYTSPLIKGSTSLYKFRLKETLVYNKTDTIFIIAYEPKKGKNFTALKGVLYINSNGYAIENIIASPANEQDLIFTFKLQQQYAKVDAFWFPKQQNTTITQKDLKTDSVFMQWDSRSYFSNVLINIPLDKKLFSDIESSYNPNTAGILSDTTWNNFRIDSLKPKEKNTYAAFDSLPKKTLFAINQTNKFIEAFAIRAIPWGKVDIPFEYLLKGLNRYERLRLGLGVQTNPTFNRFFSVGGYFGYGTKDAAFKFGGNAQFKLAERTNTNLQISFLQDVEEVGNMQGVLSNLGFKSIPSFRNFYATAMDSVQRLIGNFSTKISPTIQTNIWVLNEKRNSAQYQYNFVFDKPTNAVTFNRTEIGLGIAWRKGEKIFQFGRAKIATAIPQQQLLFQISKSIDNGFNSNLNYTKAFLQTNNLLRTKRFGVTKLDFSAGKIWGSLPLGLLFNTASSRTDQPNGIFIPNTFQTVKLYEFIGSEFATLFMQHNFGSLLLNPKNVHFKPEFVLVQGVSFATINNASKHQSISFQTAEKGLFETGFLINNLYKLDYNFMFLGLGVGAFYRYGYYALPKAIDNWSIKISFTTSL